ncbi:hypothetical protein [Acinetobacter sp. ANC 5502]
MKKYLLLWIVFFSTGVFASTPIERLLLINDFETWLNSGPSLFDWSNTREKEVKAFSDIKQPVHVYIDFKRNPIAAEEKYKSIQKISGYISSIERNYQGDPLIVFNVGDFDKIYVNGLTKNEVIQLKVPDSINLLCVGFRMDPVGNISATCSMLDDPMKFVAVNNIQLLDKQNKLDLLYKNKVKIDKVVTLISKELDPKFHTDCNIIDSLNYSSCLSLMNEAMGRIEKKR